MTAGLVAINLFTWLSVFLAQRDLWSGFILNDFRTAPWALLTYPLYTPGEPFLLLFTCYMLYWIGSSLESCWGTRKFALVTAALTVIAGLSLNLAPPLVGLPRLPLAGLGQPLAALFTMWAMLNPSATVLLMFFLPVQARFLGYAGLALLYLNTGPVLGLFALVAPLGGWYYVQRTRLPVSAKGGWRNPLDSLFRAHRRRHLRVIDGGRRTRL